MSSLEPSTTPEALATSSCCAGACASVRRRLFLASAAADPSHA